MHEPGQDISGEIDLEVLKRSFKTILQAIGEDPNREGLLRTPERASKSIAFFAKGYKMTINDRSIQEGIFHGENIKDDLVVIKDIDFFSMCEHHMIPFFGHVSIGYVPDKKILGLSKFARIVEIFSRRFQLQERLTDQIAQAVEDVLSPKGVAVLVDAEHLCMVMRGVQKMDCSTITTSSLGCIKKERDLWERFMKMTKK
ncbi:GTP cyclohydrolase 1 [Cichlidogyrus casuarinus]|uniref:GTP cyclohydrolase 1 n=1 Tax=Cichlidogyrus casuarinus TaxID=1844966 RepID=A0ABD2PIX5_9PLAT